MSNLCEKEFTIAKKLITHYWTYDEPSGSFFDSVNNAEMQVLGAITRPAGLFGNCVDFQDSVEPWGATLRHNETDGSLIPLESFSFFCWVFAPSYPVNAYIMPFRLYLTEDTGYSPYLDVQFLIRANGGANYFSIADPVAGTSSSIALAAPPAGVWTFYHAYYKKASTVIGFQINDGTPTEQTYDLTIYAATLPPVNTLFVANGATGGGAQFGYTDEFGMCLDKCLTKAQADWLYNSGTGRTWPEVDSVGLH